MKKLMCAVALSVLLAGCLTTTKRDFERSSTVGNVQFELTAVGKEDGNYQLCRVAETETKARSMTQEAFRSLRGSYRVVIERQSDSQIACWQNFALENLARDATVVGILLPDVYHPYAFYQMRVFSGDRLVYQKLVKQSERSTKSALNLNKLNNLAEEAHAIFERTYREALNEAVTAAQRVG
jgi:hypothetical protein